jgi:hypothetical protein
MTDPAALCSKPGGRLPARCAACEAPGGRLHCGMPAAAGRCSCTTHPWGIGFFDCTSTAFMWTSYYSPMNSASQSLSAHLQRTLITVATSMAGIGTAAATSATNLLSLGGCAAGACCCCCCCCCCCRLPLRSSPPWPSVLSCSRMWMPCCLAACASCSKRWCSTSSDASRCAGRQLWRTCRTPRQCFIMKRRWPHISTEYMMPHGQTEVAQVHQCHVRCCCMYGLTCQHDMGALTSRIRESTSAAAGVPSGRHQRSLLYTRSASPSSGNLSSGSWQELQSIVRHCESSAVSLSSLPVQPLSVSVHTR